MSPEFWKKKRVFITGHTGFKGSWLMEWLRTYKAEVCGYSLPKDIGDCDLLSWTLGWFQPDIVIHMAAQALVKVGYSAPEMTWGTNVQGAVNLLDSIRQMPVKPEKIIIVTSDKVYKDWGEKPHTEGDVLGGHDPYSASKGAAEFVAASYRDSYGLPIATARAGNVIGSGDWASYRLIPNIVRAKMNGKEVLIPRPDAVRPWQHVLDCLNGYLMLCENFLPEAFNFGSDDTNWSVLDVVKAFDCPYKVTEQSFVEREILTLDSSKAWDVLEWKPKLSVAKAIEWTKKGYFDKNVSKLTQIEEFMRL